MKQCSFQNYLSTSQAFKIYPNGTRKIVISTNIAETSVTIEDIVYVVDTGRHKERRYDPSRAMSMLVEDTIAVANANQRKGRAGRVREGICFSLYTRHCYETRMKKYQVSCRVNMDHLLFCAIFCCMQQPQHVLTRLQTPEIMRVPLEEMVLQIHYLKLSNTADQFLSKVLQPPSKKSVTSAITALVEIGALTKSETMTPLGANRFIYQ